MKRIGIELRLDRPGDRVSETEYLPTGDSRNSGETDSPGPQATDAGQDAASANSDDLSGRSLGEFRLIRRLGKGGMANVYLAEQTALSRHVAIKVMKRSLVTDSTYLERFKTEAMAAANLNHVNIVQVYTIGSADGYQYIAQEYVQGRNLKEFISRKGPPELAIALHIIRQLASALEKAGEAGIVHRDIKPENVLISKKGMVKIADFGLAQLTLGGERLSLTQEGVTMGTPLYMSPEQVQGQKVDHRSDIYSLGVTCYHMFAGRPPFRGESAVAIAMKHVNSEPTPLAKRRPDLPPAVCQLVHKMMAKKPADRFANAGEVLAEVRRLSKSLRSDSGPTNLEAFQTSAENSPEKSTPATETKWGIKRFAMISAATLLLGLLAGWAARPRLPENPALNATKRDQAREQLIEAVLLANSEDAWRALREYHANSEERWKAEEQLAILYLNQGRFDEAARVFDTFIERHGGNGDKYNLVPSGYAGRAVIAALTGDYTKSDNILRQNLSMLKANLDGPMKPLVRETVQQNMQHLDKPQVKLETLFPDDDAETLNLDLSLGRSGLLG